MWGRGNASMVPSYVAIAAKLVVRDLRSHAMSMREAPLKGES